jgi:uncharacterized protein YjbI with pentapeptide repeats
MTSTAGSVTVFGQREMLTGESRLKRSVAKRIGVITLVLAITGGPAVAGCNDPAGPGVDWSNCVMVALTMDGQDLSGAKLRGLLLTSSKITGSNFTGADFTEARIANTDFSGSDFTAAVFEGAHLTNVKLTATSFRNAKLKQVVATNINVTDADFEGAEVFDSWQEMTIFCRTLMPDGSLNSAACP